MSYYKLKDPVLNRTLKPTNSNVDITKNVKGLKIYNAIIKNDLINFEIDGLKFEDYSEFYEEVSEEIILNEDSIKTGASSIKDTFTISDYYKISNGIILNDGIELNEEIKNLHNTITILTNECKKLKRELSRSKWKSRKINKH